MLIGFFLLVQIVDDYIPKLCGIIAAVKAGELTLKSEPSEYLQLISLHSCESIS